jgi:hypothetical protein
MEGDALSLAISSVHHQRLTGFCWASLESAAALHPRYIEQTECFMFLLKSVIDGLAALRPEKAQKP